MVDNQTNPTEYNLDKGDVAWGGDVSYTFQATDDTDLAGKAVTMNASGEITLATDTDNHLGVVLDDTAHSASLTTEKSDDNRWTVHHGRLPVVIEVNGSPDHGIFVQPASAGDGTYDIPGTAPDPGSNLPLVVDEVDASNNLYVALMG
jgi:hypothetical protein